MCVNHFLTLIVRHRKENKKKCSLQPLITRKDCLFLTYPQCQLPEVCEAVLLSFNGPLLSKKDFDKQIILIDGTWKKAQIMEKELFSSIKIEKRSLPKGFVTAYPRKQTGCDHPDQGLASVEALFVAYLVMGRDTQGLLENYYWKEEFLEKNKDLIASLD